MKQILVNDGSKSYEIVNQDGEVLGVFRFNPSDSNIIEKYNGVVESLEAAFQKVDTGDEEFVMEASREIKEKFDDLFGQNTSKTFFSITGPLTPLSNGQLFAENVVEAIGFIIEKEMKVRVKKVQERMNKYTEKYKK